MTSTFSVAYELICFRSSSDKDFIGALKIYQHSIPHEQKTNSSEISYWIDNVKSFSIGKLFFFGLKLNNQIIGYAELAYIKRDRILIIDYITLEESYKTNSGFYTFYSLIINYIKEKNIDFDFVTKEVLCRYNETYIHKEDVTKYELENFKVINSLYIQPQLEPNNAESEKDALLMICMRGSLEGYLKKDAYMNIVAAIYEYYRMWDVPFYSDKEKYNFSINTEKNKKRILESIKTDKIKLNGYPFKYTSSENGIFIPAKRNKSFILALISVILLIIIILLILLVLNYLQYEKQSILIIGSAVILIFILLLIILDDGVVHKLKQVPFISKIYELLK